MGGPSSLGTYQMVPLQGGKISPTVVDMKAIATGRFWLFMDLFHPGVITTHGFPHVKRSFLEGLKPRVSREL